MSDEKIPLCGLWKNETQGGLKYLSGTLGGGKLLIFPNGFKTSENSPDYNLYLAKREAKKEVPVPNPEADDAPF